MSGFTQINVGTTANDGTGDSLRVSQQAVNSNFLTAVRTLSTVTDLSTEAAASGYSRIVQDLNRGGIFKAVNGGTVDNGIVFASATAGWTWQRVYEGPVKAKWFGVVADGSTNDKDNLRSAILASDGKTLLLPEGVLILNSSISASVSSINIKGFNTTIKSGSSFSDPMILITSCDDFKISGVKFDGNLNGTLIGLRVTNDEDLDSQTAFVNDCEFVNFVTSNGTSTPYGFYAYGSFNKVSVLNSRFSNIKNTAASGDRISKGFRANSVNSARGPKNVYVSNCDFKTISPVQDADAVHHGWNDGPNDTSFIVTNCNFYDVAKRCVKSQIKGQTVVQNCTAENEFVEGLYIVDLQYGGGVISGVTYICNDTNNSPSSLFKLDRYSDETDGVIIENVKVIGAEQFDGYIVDVQPENGQGIIDFVNIDDVICTVDVSNFARYRANSADQNFLQVKEVNFDKIKLKNLTSTFLYLQRATSYPGSTGFFLLANIGISNVSNLGNAQNLYTSSSSTGMGINLLKFENVRGVVFNDAYSGSQIGNSSHTLDNSLNYQICGPNNSVASATNELKKSDINTKSDSFNASSDVSTANNTITLTAHDFVSGDEVAADSSGNTLPTGILEGLRYYVSKIDDDTIKLFTNSDLVTGEVDITATGSGSCKIVALNDIFKVNLYEGITSGDNRGHVSTAFVKWQTNKFASNFGSYIAEDWMSVVYDDGAIVYQRNKINEVKNFGSGYIEPKWVFDSKAASMYFPSGVPDYANVQFLISFLSGLSGDSIFSRTLGNFEWLI